jgi:hypothetical protein
MNTSLYPKVVVFILIFFLNFLTSVVGQTKDEFEKIFLKETGSGTKGRDDGKFKNVYRLSYYPDTLPSWFFNPPPSTADYTYTIGISDPDLTPENAAIQALYRAKVMAVLFNRSQIQYFRDIYTTEYRDGRSKSYRQRFDTYFKLSASGIADSLYFTIVDQHFTRYNEAIVLIKYDQSNVNKANSSATISVVGTVFLIEAQIGDAFEPQAEYELTSAMKIPDSPMITSYFKFVEKGTKFLSQSEFMGNAMQFPLYNYKYTNPSWSSNIQPLLSYNGLWSIYTQRLLRHLTITTEDKSVKYKTIEENYSPQMSNLTREVAIKIAKIYMNGIEFGVDSVGFDLLVEKID